MQKPWLSSDFFFSLTPLGREQNSLLKITNGFVDNVRLLARYTYIVTLIRKFYPFFLQVISQRRQYLNEMKLSGKPLKYIEGMRHKLFNFHQSQFKKLIVYILS